MSYPSQSAAYSDTNPGTAQQTAAETHGPVGPKLFYFRTLSGLLKIVQFVLALIIIICGSVFEVQASYDDKAKFITFVGSFQIILTLVLFFLFFCNIIYRVPYHAIGLLVYYGILLIFILVAAILGAVYAQASPPAGAAAFFLFTDLIVTGVDAFFILRYWRGGDYGAGTSVMFGPREEIQQAQPTNVQYPGGGAPHY